MLLKKKLNLFVMTSLSIGVVVVIALIYIWQNIEKSLERLDYTIQLETSAFELQKLIVIESVSPLNSQSRWIENHKVLKMHLSKPVDLEPAQQPFFNSIKSKTDSLLILYKQLQRLSAENANHEIINHLMQRQLLQVESILEDTQSLAKLSTLSINSVFKQQIIIIAVMLSFGIILLLISTNQLVNYFHRLINKLEHSINKVRQGKYEIIEPLDEINDFSDFIKRFNQMSQQLEKTTVTRDVLQQIVEERTSALKEISETDPLTSIPNRRALFEKGEKEFSRAVRHQSEFSVLMIDCDKFKQINDKYGHLIGDKILIQLGKIFKSKIREEDYLGRYGGEEFLILLPLCDQVSAFEKAEAIRETVCSKAYSDDDLTINYSVSIGVASLKGNHKNFEHLISQADDALLKAKENGRNRVEIITSE